MTAADVVLKDTFTEQEAPRVQLEDALWTAHLAASALHENPEATERDLRAALKALAGQLAFCHALLQRTDL